MTVVRVVAALLLIVVASVAKADPLVVLDPQDKGPAAAQAAIARALPILQRSAATFVKERACVSCHHNALPIMALRLADRRGVAIDKRVLNAVETRTFRELRSDTAVDDAVLGVTLSDPTPNDSLLLMAAHDAGLPRDITTAIYARRIARWQRADGHWVTSDFRPPHSSSQFTSTATAIQALRSYMPEELSGERDDRIRRGASWLATSWPRSTEDASFRLLGLVWAGAPRETIDAATRLLLSMQLPTGGWPQTPAYAADAYSTGEALYALRVSGMPAAAREWQLGARFLIGAQAGDGTWRVRTRMISPAEISPPYFETGFPYRKDQFLSYAGTCWAVMALLSSLPEIAPTLPPAPSGPAAAPAWLRSTLFGSAQQLAVALDGGLDPNSKTAGGTTVLMAAALDGDKVRALLARQADPRVRARSGVDALTIASSHLGASPSVRALLDAGAEPQPPDGVRVRRTPLVAASMVGDADTVRLLLGRGAKASGEAVSEAVTFGHAEIVRALFDAGGDTEAVNSLGENLIHWATITNRAAVIPVLAAARVPVDATDDFGYTPLMYAATIDQGDNDTLEALLRAGADVSIRDDEGRTALQQAQRLKHLDAARVLSGH